MRGTMTRTCLFFEGPRPQARALEPKLAQAGMTVRTTAERPVIKTVLFADRQIVDAREAQAHQAVPVELPVLIAVAAKPAPRIVAPFVGEANGDAVRMKGRRPLDQPLVLLAVPFLL